MGFKGFSLKLFNADSKSSPAGRSDLQKKPASENEPREDSSLVANGPSDELASNSKFERSNDRPEPSRRSPRKKEDRASDADNNQDEIMRGPDPSPDRSTMDKPVLKLFLKSSESMGKADAFSSPSSTFNEKKDIPTLLRLRIGSSEERLPKQEPAALSIVDQVPLPEPNGPIYLARTTRKYSKKQQQLSSTGEPVVKQKRAYKKSIGTKEEPKDIFTEPRGKKAKKEKVAKPKKEKKLKISKKEKGTEAILKEKETRKSKKQRAVEAADAAAEETFEMTTEEDKPQVEKMGKSLESINSGIVNEDFCAACKHSGYFICCETCPNSFHLACVFPPLAGVPEDSWQCMDCLKTRPARSLEHEVVEAQAIVSSPNEIEGYQAMWNRVWAMTILSEPTAFNLPKRLRPKKDLPFSMELLDESAYQVQPKRRSSGGDSRKSSSSASLSGTRRSGASRSSIGAPTPTLSRRISETGQCHHCGQRSIIPELLPLRAEPIVPNPLLRCDKCPLLWHMDCLDPPLTVLPAERRWLCPAHVKLPANPNYVPKVELEDNDPFAYDMVMRLSVLPPPPAERVRLSEASIRLDFSAKARRLREEAKLNTLIPPPEVVRSYAALTEAFPSSL